MQRLTLVGLMGAGKTTVGGQLAQRWGWRFEDLDVAVERRAGKAIADLFAVSEAHFRALEAVELRRALSETGVVIGAGGGAACQPGAMDAILAGGPAVWLDAAPATLAARGLVEPHRPALAGLDPAGVAQYLDAQLARRRRHYGRATVRVEVDRLRIEQVIDYIEEALGRPSGAP